MNLFLATLFLALQGGIALFKWDKEDLALLPSPKGDLPLQPSPSPLPKDDLPLPAKPLKDCEDATSSVLLSSTVLSTRLLLLNVTEFVPSGETVSSTVLSTVLLPSHVTPKVTSEAVTEVASPRVVTLSDRVVVTSLRTRVIDTTHHNNHFTVVTSTMTASECPCVRHTVTTTAVTTAQKTVTQFATRTRTTLSTSVVTWTSVDTATHTSIIQKRFTTSLARARTATHLTRTVVTTQFTKLPTTVFTTVRHTQTIPSCNKNLKDIFKFFAKRKFGEIKSVV